MAASRRRIFRWPLFLALGLLHIGLLPLVLSEPGDDITARIAGLGYLTLAGLDRRYPAARPQPQCSR